MRTSEKRPEPNAADRDAILSRVLGGIENDLNIRAQIRMGCNLEPVEGFQDILVPQRAVRRLSPREPDANKIIVLAERLLKAQAKRDGLANGRRAAVTIGVPKERNDMSVWSEFLLNGESDTTPAGNIRVCPASGPMGGSTPP